MIDRWLDRFARLDGDLIVSEAHGFAYSHDRTVRAAYDEAYFAKCEGHFGHSPGIADAIHAGRIAFVDRHVGAETGVLDIGVGCGAFVHRRRNTYGFDINPAAIAWLKERCRWSAEIEAFEAVTLWDVIEHLPDPAIYLDRVPPMAHLFCSLPIMSDLGRIRESKHYRPGEHLQYWTRRGFVTWMALHGLSLLATEDFETRAGRDAILSFAFRKQ